MSKAPFCKYVFVGRLLCWTEGGKPAPLTIVVSQQPLAALQGPVAHATPPVTGCKSRELCSERRSLLFVSAQISPCFKMQCAFSCFLHCCAQLPCCGWVVCVPPELIAEALIPSVMVLELGAFERELGLD